MVKFQCNGCGQCCESFGEFITVEREVTEEEYFCRYGITNELFHVHILPDYVDEFATRYEETEGSSTHVPQKGCVFSHKKPDGPGVLCIIYPDRPTICRNFLCYRMVINDSRSGEIRGRVIGINELRTHDKILDAIWREKIAHLPHPFESENHKVPHTHDPGNAKVHGHDPHILAHIYGVEHADDHEWVENVLSILASHGYQGDPVD